MDTRCVRLLLVFTVIRIILLLDVHIFHCLDHYFNGFTSNYLQSAALRSILIQPTYTLSHIREALFLLRFNGGPLNYGKLYTSIRTMHLPPLCMALLEPVLTTIKSEPLQNLIIGFLMICVDLGVASSLFQIAGWAVSMQHDPNSNDAVSKWEQNLEPLIDPLIQPEHGWVFGIENSKTSQKKEEKKGEQLNDDDMTHHFVTIFDLPQLACMFYYCNPFTVLATCVAKEQTFQGILYLFLLLSIKNLIPHQGCEGKKPSVSMAAFFLSLLTYLEIYPVVFLIPMILLVKNSVKSNQEKNAKAMSLVGFFLLWTVILQALSGLLVGYKNLNLMWIKTYGHGYTLKEIPPNLKALWYLNVQVTHLFRPLYAMIFAGTPYIVILPLVTRLHRYPFVLVTMFAFVWIFYRTVITVPDISFALSVLVLSPKSLSRVRILTLISLLALPVPIVMYTFDYWLWLEPGSGNPNYMFFMGMAFETFFALIFLDFLMASLKRDKALRVTEKIFTKSLELHE